MNAIPKKAQQNKGLADQRPDDQGLKRVNMDRTGSKIDTPLTRPSSRPVRIQRKRTKGWKMPPNTVSVTRPSKWGNPWKVELFSTCGCHDPIDAVRLFREHEAARLKPMAIAELRGKNLACFCPLAQPCHADVLLEIANSPPWVLS